VQFSKIKKKMLLDNIWIGSNVIQYGTLQKIQTIILFSNFSEGFTEKKFNFKYKLFFLNTTSDKKNNNVKGNKKLQILKINTSSLNQNIP